MRYRGFKLAKAFLQQLLARHPAGFHFGSRFMFVKQALEIIIKLFGWTGWCGLAYHGLDFTRVSVRRQAAGDAGLEEYLGMVEAAGKK